MTDYPLSLSVAERKLGVPELYADKDNLEDELKNTLRTLKK